MRAPRTTGGGGCCTGKCEVEESSPLDRCPTNNRGGGAGLLTSWQGGLGCSPRREKLASITFPNKMIVVVR